MNTNPQTHDSAAVFNRRVPGTGTAPFLLGSALLGTIGVFVYEAHVDPLTATWFRCASGLIGLTLWAILRGQTRMLRLNRATAPWVLIAAALMVLNWGLFFSAIERVSAGVAIVLFHVQPMWVLLLGAWCLKEPVGKRRFGAVCAAMLGLALATGIAEHKANDALAPGYWLGVALCLVGAFCMACVTIIARRLRDMPAGILAWWQCAIGTLTLWMWPMQHGWPAWGASWLWLAGLGVIHTGLAYTLIYAGMARLNTGRIAVLQFVYPAVAIVIDWLFFDQRLSGLQLSGIALMSVAIGFAERMPRD
ncbi:DMT family transporter [Caballeronia insecticola]|uniref:Putative permease transmembrane protein n=1 Tax=Caballeronia insecticola TaxID=758793 RepID=R4WQ73_9BURK|nr:DMT family transporter [Caballeronia insecticola]BAN26808.1 putative permease transmembrane protein [Caballeronia insecticola]